MVIEVESWATFDHILVVRTKVEASLVARIKVEPFLAVRTEVKPLLAVRIEVEPFLAVRIEVEPFLVIRIEVEPFLVNPSGYNLASPSWEALWVSPSFDYHQLTKLLLL